MRVLLIQPPQSRPEKLIYLPLTLLTIGTEIASVNNEVRILDFNLELHRRQQIFDNSQLSILDRQVSEFKPSVIGLTASCFNLPIVFYIIKYLKRKYKNIQIVLGGPYVSLIPNKVMSVCPEIDIVVIGEGEITCRQLFADTKLSLQDVQGIIYRDNNNDLHYNNSRELVGDLDQLLPLNYSLVDMEAYANRGDALYRTTFYEIGRGCTYNCSFCSTSKMWGRNYRVKSIKTVIKAIRELKENYGIKNFDFIHDNLLIDSNYVKLLSNTLLQEKLNVRWSCTARADGNYVDSLKLLYESGCYRLVMGIETASSKLQHDIGKRLNTCKSLNVIKDCIKCGLQVSPTFMVGLPNESNRDFEDTLKLALRCRLAGCSGLQIHKYLPHPSTALYEKNKNSIVKRKHHHYFMVWNELSVPLNNLILKHPDIFTSFFHVPAESGSETFLHDAEYISYLLINHFPRTLLLLTQHYNVSFTTLIKLFQDFGITGHTLYAIKELELSTILEKILYTYDSKISADNVFSNILKYESTIHLIQITGMEKARAKNTSNISSERGQYYLNNLFNTASFCYDIDVLVKTIISNRANKIQELVFPVHYAFVFWKGTIEIYEIEKHIVMILATLPLIGTRDEYLLSIEEHGLSKFDSVELFKVFQANHVINLREEAL
ncbi:MAG: radical SAM protein [Pseudomonadota bacterium]